MVVHTSLKCEDILSLFLVSFSLVSAPDSYSLDSSDFIYLVFFFLDLKGFCFYLKKSDRTNGSSSKSRNVMGRFNSCHSELCGKNSYTNSRASVKK